MKYLQYLSFVTLLSRRFCYFLQLSSRREEDASLRLATVKFAAYLVHKSLFSAQHFHVRVVYFSVRFVKRFSKAVTEFSNVFAASSLESISHESL